MCLPSNCRFHIKLIGKIKDWRQKLEAICLNHQHVDCLYTLSNYNSVAKLLSRVDNFLIMCRGLFVSTTKTGGGQHAKHREKGSLEEKVQENLLSSFEKSKLTRTGGLVIANRTEQVKKTKFGGELIKFLNCFPDGHGKY